MDVIERVRSRRKKNAPDRYFDYNLLFIILFLIIFGLLMIFSASSYEAYAQFEDSAYFMKKQLVASLIGIAGMVLFSFIPYKVWGRIPFWVYLTVTAVLFLLLLVPQFSVTSHGATRWLKVPFIKYQLQPAEVAKIAMILMYAKLLADYGWIMKQWKGFIVFVLSILPIAAVIYFLSKNFSSAAIVAGIIFCMGFVATNDWKKFGIFTAGAGGALALFVFCIIRFADPDDSNFRFQRVIAWVYPEKFSDSISYQTMQSLYAIGSGGIFGKGIGESMQKLNYIPEAQNDMIFSIICEELGFFGAMGVVILFIVLLWRLMTIAYNIRDLYGALIISGVFAHVAIQAVLNIAVVTNSVPNTGVSLPFISYGGSSLLFLLLEMGIVLNIARHIKFKE